MYFTYMECKSAYAFKAQNIAFRENPPKRTGMHQNCGFGLRKDQLFHKDFHLFSRKYIIQYKLCKIWEINDSDRIIEIPCKKLGVLGTKGALEKCVGPYLYKGFCMPAPGCSQLPGRGATRSRHANPFINVRPHALFRVPWAL